MKGFLNGVKEQDYGLDWWKGVEMENEITECPLDSSSKEDDYAIPSCADDIMVNGTSTGAASSSGTTHAAVIIEDPRGTGARPKTTRARSGSVQMLGLPWSRFKDQSHGARAPNPSHHRTVRPFFCCGSELSLISMMDNVDPNVPGRRCAAGSGGRVASLEDKVGVAGDRDERMSNHPLSHSRSCSVDLGAACGSGASVQTVCGVGRAGEGTSVRRMKSDKSKNKKGFWSLRFRDKLPGSLKFAHMRRSACTECGSKKCNASRVPPCDFMCEKGKACPCRKVSYQCAAAELARRRGMIPDRRASFAGVFPISGNEELLARERSLERAASHSRSHGEGMHRFSSSVNEVSLSQLASHLQAGSAVSELVLRESLQKDLVAVNVVNAMLHDSMIHTRIDFIHHLVPDLQKITSCSFYWGVIDRYEAERLLDKKREGTFLLRDSAQDDFLFSVSFRRYNRSLHARIEQWNHRFSFDVHDPAVYSADSVCGLIEHYKDSSRCLFFEPMLTDPLHRTFPFTLQHLARAVICKRLGKYDQISRLPLPVSMKTYLRYYHYKQKVCVRSFEEPAS